MVENARPTRPSTEESLGEPEKTPFARTQQLELPSQTADGYVVYVDVAAAGAPISVPNLPGRSGKFHRGRGFSGVVDCLAPICDCFVSELNTQRSLDPVSRFRFKV